MWPIFAINTQYLMRRQCLAMWPIFAILQGRAKYSCMFELSLLVLRSELRKSLRTCFGEFCSCCCLSLLPQPAYYILTTSYKDFFSALYNGEAWFSEPFFAPPLQTFSSEQVSSSQFTDTPIYFFFITFSISFFLPGRSASSSTSTTTPSPTSSTRPPTSSSGKRRSCCNRWMDDWTWGGILQGGGVFIWCLLLSSLPIPDVQGDTSPR